MRDEAGKSREAKINKEKRYEVTQMQSSDLLREIMAQDSASAGKRTSAYTSGSSSNKISSPKQESSAKPAGGSTEEEKLLKEILDQMKELNFAIRELLEKSSPENAKTPPERSSVQRVSDTPPERSYVQLIPQPSPAVPNPNISDEVTEKTPSSSEKDTPIPKKKKRFKWIGEVVFYLLLVVMIFGAFLIKSNSGGRPNIIAGYSAFTVLTGSMQDEIPQGSLVITKVVDAKTLEIGDDITFMVSETASITHRIVGITESYQNTGERAFETQGIMNANPDKDPVPAANVVGKVVFHSELLGEIASFATKNWPFLLFLMAVLIILVFVLKRLLKDTPSEKKAISQLENESKMKKSHTKHKRKN